MSDTGDAWFDGYGPIYYRLREDYSVEPITLQELLGEPVPQPLLQEHVGDVWVSTVFLGMDHQLGEGPPLLFETMVFAAQDETQQEEPEWMGLMQRRCSTYDDAVEQHAEIVARVATWLQTDTPTLEDVCGSN